MFHVHFVIKVFLACERTRLSVLTNVAGAVLTKHVVRTCQFDRDPGSQRIICPLKQSCSLPTLCFTEQNRNLLNTSWVSHIQRLSIGTIVQEKVYIYLGSI